MSSSRSNRRPPAALVAGVLTLGSCTGCAVVAPTYPTPAPPPAVVDRSTVDPSTSSRVEVEQRTTARSGASRQHNAPTQRNETRQETRTVAPAGAAAAVNVAASTNRAAGNVLATGDVAASGKAAVTVEQRSTTSSEEYSDDD